MPVDAEQQWSYQVVFGGESSPLEVRVFMDDIEAPDVAFITTQNLADAIEQEMIKFAEELGI